MAYLVYALIFLSQTSQGASLKCENQRSVSLERSQSDPHPSLSLIIQPNNLLLYNIDAETSLTFNSLTNQYFWNLSDGSKTPVQFDGDLPYYQEGTTLSRNDGEKIQLPSSARSAIADLKQIGHKNIFNKISECRKKIPFRDQLKAPMTPLEINTCKSNLEKLNKLQTCFDKNKCAEDFKTVFSPESQNYSFVKLFESDTQMSDPEQRVGVAMAADSGISWAVPGMMLANKARVAAVAGRIGVSFASVFGWVNALLTLSTPIIMTAIDYDDCGDGGFSGAQGRSVTDCIGQKSADLERKFSADILNAIENPAGFFNDVARRPDGQIARLACYVFEANLNQWKQAYKDYGKPLCQGRSLSFANGNTYIIDSDSHLYRHEDSQKAFHFYSNSETLVEDKYTGKRSPAITVDEFLASTSTSGRRGSVRTQTLATPDSSNIVSQRILQEQTMIQGLYPEMQKSIRDGVCIDGDVPETPRDSTPSQL